MGYLHAVVFLSILSWGVLIYSSPVFLASTLGLTSLLIRAFVFACSGIACGLEHL